MEAGIEPIKLNYYQRGIKMVLWIVQGILAFAFGMTGFMKLTQPYEGLKEKMAWVEDFQPNQIKMIGVAELLGVIGLIFPEATDMLPILTPLAALGLVAVMSGAAYTHYGRKEMPMIGVNMILGVLALFVAIGRF